MQSPSDTVKEEIAEISKSQKATSTTNLPSFFLFPQQAEKEGNGGNAQIQKNRQHSNMLTS